MRILLIDGDDHSTDHLKREIQEHYLVDVAFGGSEGDYMAQVNDYAAIVIESNLPDFDNAELCRSARENNVAAPILLLFDCDDPDLRIKSLDCGADMILTKPIDPKELRAYLRILTARSYKRPRKNSLQVGELKLNMKTKMVTHKEHELDLRRKEYEILEYLMINKGNIVSKANLLEQIWEEGICVMSNTLEVHMKNLRDKVDRPFGSKLIKTVRGFGYKISE